MSRPPDREAPSTSRVEWIVAGASALLVLGAIGYLVYDGVRSPATPPDVTIEIDSIGAAGPGYLVQFHARNRGRSTAADVLVEGELRADTGRVEVSQTTIDYLPPAGTQQGGLYFAHDPRQFRLELKPHGYERP